MAEHTGRVALIAGGAGGIGSAVSAGFARDGAQVVVADLEAGRAAEGAGGRERGPHSSLAVDVVDPSSVEAAVQLLTGLSDMA